MGLFLKEMEKYVHVWSCFHPLSLPIYRADVTLLLPRISQHRTSIIMTRNKHYLLTICIRYYFVPAVRERCIVRLCLSDCMFAPERISRITRPNFAEFCVRVSCGRGLVLLCFVLPVLRMTAYLPITAHGRHK